MAWFIFQTLNSKCIFAKGTRPTHLLSLFQEGFWQQNKSGDGFQEESHIAILEKNQTIENHLNLSFGLPALQQGLQWGFNLVGSDI